MEEEAVRTNRDRSIAVFMRLCLLAGRLFVNSCNLAHTCSSHVTLHTVEMSTRTTVSKHCSFYDPNQVVITLNSGLTAHLSSTSTILGVC